jgi:hypothetical protein
MSECDITIEFDKADRSYQAGETITGKVRLTPKARMHRHKVMIEIVWATRGRGNGNGATGDGLEYAGRHFQPGQTVEYEFRFTAPPGPLTYHGHYLKIDHYIKVRLETPGHRDHEVGKEFILLPGPTCKPSQPPHSVSTVGQRPKNMGCAVAAIVAAAIALMLTGLPPTVGFVLIVGAFGIFKLFGGSQAEKLLGKTTLSLSRNSVAPNEWLPVSVEFSPTRSIKIDGVVAILRGYEQVISGSEGKRKTHTKTIFQKQYPISGSLRLPPGRQVISGDIPIPKTGAWTFCAEDNRLIWEVTMRVYIPDRPDWSASTELKLHPIASETLVPCQVIQTPSPPPVRTITPTPVAEPSGAPASIPLEPIPVEPKPAADGPAYERDLQEIMESDRFGSQRGDLVAKASGRTYDLEITTKSSSWTLESTMPLEYRNGRTVIAAVENTASAEITVYFPEEANQEIDKLPAGTTMRLAVRPHKFNKFYNRMETMAEQHQA